MHRNHKNMPLSTITLVFVDFYNLFTVGNSSEYPAIINIYFLDSLMAYNCDTACIELTVRRCEVQINIAWAITKVSFVECNVIIKFRITDSSTLSTGRHSCFRKVFSFTN